MRVVDGEEYPNIWKGMWWALQTVTTVGYGDVTPKNTSGRIVGAFVMLEGVAFLSILVAAITSIFVARAQRERQFEAERHGGDHGPTGLHERFDELEARLEQARETVDADGLDRRRARRLRRSSLELSHGEPAERFEAEREEPGEDEHAEPAAQRRAAAPTARAGGRGRPSAAQTAPGRSRSVGAIALRARRA